MLFLCYFVSRMFCSLALVYLLEFKIPDHFDYSFSIQSEALLAVRELYHCYSIFCYIILSGCRQLSSSLTKGPQLFLPYVCI